MQEKVRMALEDTETVINFSQYDIGEWAELYTTDKGIMRRFEKFSSKHPDYCKLLKEDQYSMTFSVHPKCASLYPHAPRKMNYTEEDRKRLAENLKQARMKLAE